MIKDDRHLEANVDTVIWWRAIGGLQYGPGQRDLADLVCGDQAGVEPA